MKDERKIKLLQEEIVGISQTLDSTLKLLKDTTRYMFLLDDRLKNVEEKIKNDN